MLKNAVNRIICWKCRKFNGYKFQLLNVRKTEVDKKGNSKLSKTDDYICLDCKNAGFYQPETPNSSTIPAFIFTKEFVQAYRDVIMESEKAAAPGTEVPNDPA